MSRIRMSDDFALRLGLGPSRLGPVSVSMEQLVVSSTQEDQLFPHPEEQDCCDSSISQKESVSQLLEDLGRESPDAESDTCNKDNDHGIMDSKGNRKSAMTFHVFNHGDKKAVETFNSTIKSVAKLVVSQEQTWRLSLIPEWMPGNPLQSESLSSSGSNEKFKSQTSIEHLFVRPTLTFGSPTNKVSARKAATISTDKVTSPSEENKRRLGGRSATMFTGRKRISDEENRSGPSSSKVALGTNVGKVELIDDCLGTTSTSVGIEPSQMATSVKNPEADFPYSDSLIDSPFDDSFLEKRFELVGECLTEVLQELYVPVESSPDTYLKDKRLTQSPKVLVTPLESCPRFQLQELYVPVESSPDTYLKDKRLTQSPKVLVTPLESCPRIQHFLKSSQTKLNPNTRKPERLRTAHLGNSYDNSIASGKRINKQEELSESRTSSSKTYINLERENSFQRDHERGSPRLFSRSKKKHQVAITVIPADCIDVARITPGILFSEDILNNKVLFNLINNDGDIKQKIVECSTNDDNSTKATTTKRKVGRCYNYRKECKECGKKRKECKEQHHWESLGQLFTNNEIKQEILDSPVASTDSPVASTSKTDISKTTFEKKQQSDHAAKSKASMSPGTYQESYHLRSQANRSNDVDRDKSPRRGQGKRSTRLTSAGNRTEPDTSSSPSSPSKFISQSSRITRHRKAATEKSKAEVSSSACPASLHLKSKEISANEKKHEKPTRIASSPNRNQQFASSTSPEFVSQSSRVVNRRRQLPVAIVSSSPPLSSSDLANQSQGFIPQGRDIESFNDDQEEHFGLGATQGFVPTFSNSPECSQDQMQGWYKVGTGIKVIEEVICDKLVSCSGGDIHVASCHGNQDEVWLYEPWWHYGGYFYLLSAS